MSESSPLLASPTSAVVDAESAVASRPPPTYRQRLAKGLESQKTEWAIIGLTALDGVCVLSDLGYDYLKNPSCICDHSCPPDPTFLGIFSRLSAAITALFVLEILLTLYAFGFKHYTTVEHAYFHLFDAAVILSTFVLEFGLKGREAQIAGLLVLFRLWRLMRLMSAVVDLTEYETKPAESARADQERWKGVFEREKAGWEREKAELLRELGELRRRVGTTDVLGGRE